MLDFKKIKSKRMTWVALLIFGIVLFMVSQEQLLINQLNGRGLPNPIAAFITRNYSERRIIEAAQTLGKNGFKSEKVVTALIEGLNKYQNVDSGDGLILVRSEIALALGRIGDPAAIKPLIAILASNDPVTLSATAMVPPGYKLVERTSHGAVAEALGMFGEQAKEAVPYIVPILRYSGFRLEFDSGRAARALGQIKARESIPALVEALSNPYCRADAAEALGNFGSQAKEALPVLRAVAQQSDTKMYEQSAITDAIKKINQ